MSNKGHNKSGLLKNVFNLLVAMPVMINVVSKMKMLVKEETHTAFESVGIVSLLIAFAISLTVITWVCLLSLLFLYLISLNLSLILSLFYVMLLNVVASIILLSVIFKMKKRIRFPGIIRFVKALLQH